jgi:hypothetical protein
VVREAALIKDLVQLREGAAIPAAKIRHMHKPHNESQKDSFLFYWRLFNLSILETKTIDREKSDAVKEIDSGGIHRCTHCACRLRG